MSRYTGLFREIHANAISAVSANRRRWEKLSALLALLALACMWLRSLPWALRGFCLAG